ncbi:MAG TPA: hypothetical protein V6D29_18200 [Leptolyngbyaceae cyanobacterium]
MDKTSCYWQLVRLDSAGRCRIQPLPEVKAWVVQTYRDLLQTTPLAEAELQEQLLQRAQSTSSEAPLAQLALRCFITHQIRQVCIGLEQQFGSRYSFSRDDLFPLVLDDDGQSSVYQPLTVQILASYDPLKARLSTWSARLIKNHAEINQFFLERGLYRASDWAILNDTTPEQLDRILGEYHQCGAGEIESAKDLLSRYHQVYRRDRLLQRQQGQTGRCQSPSVDQLQQMVPEASPKTTLTRLQGLAGQLREYRIYARGGTPFSKIVSFDTQEPEDLERQMARLTPARSVLEDEADNQSEFIEVYRTQLKTCLDHALVQVIQSQVTKLQKRKPPKDQAFVQGLQLFHCEGLSMTAIAPKIGEDNQVQVTRLLNLKRLRTDVRLVLIPQLQHSIRDEALRFISADRLNQIDQTLDQILSDEVEKVIQEAASEAQIPKGRTAKSLFAYQLCQTIHQFITSYE